MVAFSIAALALSFCASPQSRAQDVAPQAEASEATPTEKKLIHEPVHRVPKVASNTTPSRAPNVNRNIRPTNNTPNAKLKTPAVLPSSTKIVPAPVEPVPNKETPAVEPTPTPVPKKNKISAIKASTVKPVKPAPHPLDDALSTARRGLENMRTNVKDYSAIMVKRERVNGELLKPEYMQVKVRSERVDDNGKLTPFGIYIKFIKPKANAGREVIWVKGQNNGKLFVHEAKGIVSLKTFQLDPTSWLAMKGQRYPICEAGMENLIVKLIEKAERDRAAGDCEVNYRTGVKINGRECDVIEVVHPEQREPYDFHVAKVYIDKELKMPIRYQALIWPEPGSTKPKLLEEYTYLNVKVNQGFTDIDFSPENPLYSFP